MDGLSVSSQVPGVIYTTNIVAPMGIRRQGLLPIVQNFTLFVSNQHSRYAWRQSQTLTFNGNSSSARCWAKGWRNIAYNIHPEITC